MQTSLMVLDLPSKGFLTDIDKIAIKMPKGHGELENGAFGGFADIINALMATVPAEDLQKSLDQLEWVPVEEGGVPGFAPLIDLTQEQAKAIGMAKHLLTEAAPETLRQAETLKSVLFPTVEAAEVKNALPSVEAAVVKNESVLTENGLKVPVQDTGNQKNHRELTGLQLEQMRGGLARNSADDEEMTTRAAEEMKPQSALRKEDTARLQSKMTEGSQEKELPPVLQRTEGGQRESKIEPTEKRTSRLAPLQQSNGHARPDAETGQQFAGNPEQGAMSLEKRDVKTHVRDEAAARDFKPGIVENALEPSKDSNEPLTKSSTEMREAQGPMSKVKPTIGERSESVSGARETGPNTQQEVQKNVIRQIVQRMTLHTHGTRSTMSIRLKPEFLGQVQMQISTEQQQVVVRMATESFAVKEMVEQGLQYLKSELQQHGLEIDKFDVFVADDNEDTKHGQDWAGFRQALKRRQQDGMKKGNNGADEGESHVSDDVDSRRAPNSTGEVDYFA